MQSGGISEEKRVYLTQQVRELRDSTATQIAFSSSLTSDERKFVHKIAQEFGLKSKSQGKDDNRFITVLKRKENIQKSSGLTPALWHPHGSVLQALSDPAFQVFLASAPGHKQSSVKGVNGSAAVVPARDFSIPPEAYHAAQQIRRQNRNYAIIQKKRNSLPAAQYRDSVCDLLKRHQIVLVSGETGGL